MTYPFAYPLVLSAASRDAGRGRGSGQVVPTKDLRPSRRLSSQPVAATRERLSARDWEILRLVSRFRIMSGGQLRHLFWPDGAPGTKARLARHGLSRLSGLGVLEPLGRRVGGVRAGSAGLTFAVGLVGQRLLTSDASTKRTRRAYTPGERHLAHTLAIGQLYVELVEVQRLGRAELLAFDPEPACWRTYLGPYGARLALKPDAYVRLGVGEYEYSWLVEQDMATESRSTLEGKARRYLDYYRAGVEQREHGVFPRVARIVPDAVRAEVLRRTLERLPSESQKLFAIATVAEATALLTDGAVS